MMKCPRDRLLSLRVETFHSDEVLPEILLILGAEDVFTIDVELERASRRMTIEVRFDSLLMRPTAGLLRRLETLRAVQSADFFDQANRLIDVGWKRRAH